MNLDNDKQNEILNDLINSRIPKYYIFNIEDEIKKPNIILEHYYLSFDRLEYAIYTNTFPYTIFILYCEDRLYSFSINETNIRSVLQKMLKCNDVIAKGEFFDEYKKIKVFLTFLKNNLDI
jgi:hypothetical protein